MRRLLEEDLWKEDLVAAVEALNTPLPPIPNDLRDRAVARFIYVNGDGSNFAVPTLVYVADDVTSDETASFLHARIPGTFREAMATYSGIHVPSLSGCRYDAGTDGLALEFIDKEDFVIEYV